MVGESAAMGAGRSDAAREFRATQRVVEEQKHCPDCGAPGPEHCLRHPVRDAWVAFCKPCFEKRARGIGIQRVLSAPRVERRSLSPIRGGLSLADKIRAARAGASRKPTSGSSGRGPAKFSFLNR